MTIRKQQLQSLLITSEIRDVVLTVQGAEDGHVLPEGRTQCRNENEEMNNQKEWKRKKERERMGCNGSEKHTWWCRCPCSLERRTRKSSFQRQPAHKRKWCSKILVEWQRCNTEHTHTHVCALALALYSYLLLRWTYFQCFVVCLRHVLNQIVGKELWKLFDCEVEDRQQFRVCNLEKKK